MATTTSIAEMPTYKQYSVHCPPDDIATMTADPATGTIPTGYLILNVTEGTLKRHAGGYSWETIVGAIGGKLGFYGVTPVTQPSGADQAAVTLGNTDGEIGNLTQNYTHIDVDTKRRAIGKMPDVTS